MLFLRVGEKGLPFLWDYYETILIEFVRALKMGNYYGDHIGNFLKYYLDHMIVHLEENGETISPKDLVADDSRRLERLAFIRENVENFCVELLRYQEWSPPQKQ